MQTSLANTNNRSWIIHKNVYWQNCFCAHHFQRIWWKHQRIMESQHWLGLKGTLTNKGSTLKKCSAKTLSKHALQLVKALCEWLCLQRTVQSIDLSVFWALFRWCLTGVYKGKLRGPHCLFLCSLLLVTDNSFQAIQPGKMETGVCQGWEVKAIMCRPGSEIFICTKTVLDNQIVEN